MLNTAPAQFQDRARAQGAGAGAGLRVDEPAAVLRRVQAREGHVRQHRLRGQRHAVAARKSRCWSRRASAAGRGVRPDGRAADDRRRRTRCATTCARRRRCCSRRAGHTATAPCATRKGEPLVDRVPGQHGGARRARDRPWQRALEKLGIELTVRARWTSRCTSSAWTTFEFDMISDRVPRHALPGQPTTRTCSAARPRTCRGSGNYMGIKNPAVDALVASSRWRDRPGRTCWPPAARSTA